MDFTIKNCRFGISVFGYYEMKGILYFTCVNQDSSTPQFDWNLNFNLPVGEGFQMIREGCKNWVFIPIEAPKN